MILSGLFKKIRNYLRSYLRGVLNEEYSTESLKKNGLLIGERFNRQAGVIIDYSFCWLIKIGNDVTLAPDVRILAHDASTKTFLGYTRIANVTIGDNVFIGAGSIILPGVNIGDNVIVGAGSVVTKDIPSNSLAVGSPATVVAPLGQFLEKHKQQMSNSCIFDDSWTIQNGVSMERRNEMRKSLGKNDGYIV